MDSRDTQIDAEMVPIGEVARLLGVSVDTIRRWEKAGRITARRTPGGQRRFPTTEVDRLRSTDAEVVEA